MTYATLGSLTDGLRALTAPAFGQCKSCEPSPVKKCNGKGAVMRESVIMKRCPGILMKITFKHGKDANIRHTKAY